MREREGEIWSARVIMCVRTCVCVCARGCVCKCVCLCACLSVFQRESKSLKGSFFVRPEVFMQKQME